MPTDQELEDQARQQAREVLTKQPNFSQLDRNKQFDQYKSLVSTIYNQLVEQERAKEIQRKDGQLAAQQSFSGTMAASDLINNKQEHLNQRVEEQGKLAGGVLREVNFPKFVKDLLKSVFDANLQVTKDQMDSYADLVKRITEPASKFIKDIDDDTAMMFLAETYSNQYKLISSDESAGKMKLSTSNGEDLDEEDNQSAITRAKIELVTRQQRFLEEMLLMGVTRMVVDHGKVKASLNFNIKATEDITRKDTAKQTDSDNDTTNKSLGVSVKNIFSSWLGGITPSGEYKDTDTQMHLMVSTSTLNSKSTTDATTNIQGEVEINFKSDYFKLDNFKDILQPSGQRSQAQKSPVASNPEIASNADGQVPEPAEA